jgi:hypothetical protein
VRTVLKLILNAVVAWIAGLLFIAGNLYFSNNGSDFTLIDLTGFGVITIVVSGLMMLLLYLPSLYRLRRRFGMLHPRIKFALLTGIVCNLPIFLFLAFLINRKMSAMEALGFMLAFLVIGVSFGLGFTFVHSSSQSDEVSTTSGY